MSILRFDAYECKLVLLARILTLGIRIRLHANSCIFDAHTFTLENSSVNGYDVHMHIT